MSTEVNVFWFRRDLRIHDNHGFFEALNSSLPVVPIFIFDKNILGRLQAKDDARVSFIHQAISKLNAAFVEKGSSLRTYFGTPREAFVELTSEYKIRSVFTNHDYEPYAQQRDQAIAQFLNKQGVEFKTFKDHVIFERNEVCKENGEPYVVFTPYMRRWKQKLTPADVKGFASQSLLHQLAKSKALTPPTLARLGFEVTKLNLPAPKIDVPLLKKYEKQRNLPAENGTSRLGVHLRFGTVSVRELVKQAQKVSESWLNELIWREFFTMILYHFPKTAEEPFRDLQIKWRNDKAEFAKWKAGQTGYPMVDAGMRELLATGFMHNRARMIVGSFLCKHLLIDWRWGERYFAEKLLDFELASNVGNWQWVAGTGSDAAPYFRVFNPLIQAEKFDPNHAYVRKWIPEWQTANYPEPIVEHKLARLRALKAVSRVKAD